MGMTIDESITELEKARNSIEPCLFIDEAIDQSMKTAIEVMRKYQKIDHILDKSDNGEQCMYDTIQEIEELMRGNAE